MKRFFFIFLAFFLFNSCLEIFQYIEVYPDENIYIKLKLTLSKNYIEYIGFTNDLDEFLNYTLKEWKANKEYFNDINIDLITNSYEKGLLFTYLQQKYDDLIPFSPYYYSNQIIIFFPKNQSEFDNLNISEKKENKIILETLKYRLLIKLNTNFILDDCYFFNDDTYYKLNVLKLKSLYYLEVPLSLWIYNKDNVPKLEINLKQVNEKITNKPNIEFYEKEFVFSEEKIPKRYYTIQVGIFENFINAENIARIIRKLNVIPEIEEIYFRNKISYKVRVGKFENKLECQELLSKIQKLDYSLRDSFIIYVDEK